MHIRRITPFAFGLATLISVQAWPAAAVDHDSKITAPVIGSNVTITGLVVRIPIITSPSVDGDVTFTGFQIQRVESIWSTALDSPPLGASFVEARITHSFLRETEYSVRIRALGVITIGGGEVRGLESNSVAVRLRATPPTSVAVSPTVGDPTSLTVTYAAPTSRIASGVIGYRYSVDGGSTWGAAGVDGDATTFQIRELDPGTTSQVLVQAFNAGFDGEASSPAVVVRSGVPEAPQALRADGGIVDGSLTLHWDRPGSYAHSALTGFEYSVDGGDWLGGVGAGASGAVITGLVDDAPTVVRVRALNPSGVSPSSNAVSLNMPVEVEEPPRVAPPSAPSSGGGGGGGGSVTPSAQPMVAEHLAVPLSEVTEPDSSSNPSEVVLALAPDRLREMSADQLAQMPAEAFGMMTAAQIRTLGPEQITQLTGAQIAAIEPAALRAMRPETLRKVRISELRSLTVEQARALRAKQIRALGPAKRRLLLALHAK